MALTFWECPRCGTAFGSINAVSGVAMCWDGTAMVQVTDRIPGNIVRPPWKRSSSLGPGGQQVEGLSVAAASVEPEPEPAPRARRRTADPPAEGGGDQPVPAS